MFVSLLRLSYILGEGNVNSFLNIQILFEELKLL